MQPNAAAGSMLNLAQNWWTGRAPIFGECPGVLKDGTMTSLPQLQLKSSTRQQLIDYFDNSWTLTEVLFSSLQEEEAFYKPPYHQLRHPLIFYYCHPAVLYVNKLRLAGLLSSGVNPYFEQLFETGVDEMSWDDLSKNEMRWPAVSEITEYRRTVYGIVHDLLSHHLAFADGRGDTGGLWAMGMSFEHERIHFETSSVLLRELPLQYLKKPKAWPGRLSGARPFEPSPYMKRIPEGRVTIGKPQAEDSFGWDNEYGHREVAVPAFDLAPFLVSNAEFLDFVKAGGYREKRFWSETGWSWRLFRNTKFPVFWVPDGPSGLNQFKLRLIFDLVAFEPSLPAVVNFHEAEAYCAWKSELAASSGEKRPNFRLSTEAEEKRLRSMVEQVSNNNLGLKLGAESPVDAFISRLKSSTATASSISENAPGNEATEVGDVFGNVWRWCADEFHPLPGFQVHPYYEDFSTPCFDGKHQMVLGGSFVSTGDEAGPFARFHFRPHFYQHAGFRLVRSVNASDRKTRMKVSDTEGSSESGINAYETKELLSQYLLFHFGKRDEIIPFSSNLGDEAFEFPKRCAETAIRHARRLKLPMAKALDIGCAVGRSSFELAKEFSAVTGVDLSLSFVNAARTLKSNGSLSYFRKDEGDLGQQLTAEVDKGIDRSRLTFRQADACALPAEFVDFDVVLMANLLCRLPSPRACLARMCGARGIVKPGGLLVIVSPYSWLDSYTHKQAWLGGFEKDGQRIRGTEALRQILSAEFECLEEDELPLIIREHERKYQYIFSHLMVWQRRR